MKKVMITGANGFIGRFCVPYLLKSGFEVHGISRNINNLHPSVNWHRADLLNDDLAELMNKIRPSHFLHLAWVTEHGKFWDSPLNEAWLKISLKLVNNFQAAGGERFVSAGTCAEYSWDGGECIEDVTSETPSFLYGQKKKIFSNELSRLSAETKLSTACGRIFLLYGPGEAETRLIPSVIASLQKHQIVRCSDGMQFRDFMYVDDVAEAMVRLLDSSVQGIVNVASGNPIQIKEVILQLSQLLGADQQLIDFGAVPRASGEPDVLTASVQRLAKEVGYSAKTSLIEGLNQTIKKISP